jgi:hypothetical protein
MAVFSRQTLAPIPHEINPVHILKSHFPKISFNVILPSTPRPYKWIFPFGFFQLKYCEKSSISLDITTFSPVKVDGRFGRPYRLRFKED